MKQNLRFCSVSYLNVKDLGEKSLICLKLFFLTKFAKTIDCVLGIGDLSEEIMQVLRFPPPPPPPGPLLFLFTAAMSFELSLLILFFYSRAALNLVVALCTVAPSPLRFH